MLRRRSSPPILRTSVLTVIPVLACVASCRSTEETPHVGISTQFSMPKSVLTRATKLSLTVLEGNVTCDEGSGQIAFPGGPTDAKQLAQSDLGNKGCASGARFCGEVTVDRSETPRFFEAVATDDGGDTLALGCTQATINDAEGTVAITMVRYLPPAVCGDGILQPTEQCEPGSTAVCDDACQSKEILLSVGATANKTSTGTSGDKTQPFFLWPEGKGAQGGFIAFYTDRATGRSNDLDVSMRWMSDDLSPATSPPALTAASIFLPNGTGFPPSPAPFSQSAPAAAFAQGTYYVAFQDDDTVSPNGLDIHLRSMDGSFVAQQGTTALGVNGTDGAGEPNIQQAPAIASGPQNRLFVAWEDAAQGKIVGRTFTPPSTPGTPGTLGSQNDISTGNGNAHVSLAATSTGWVAVWQSGTSIKLRTINADGTPEGSEQTVNEGGMSAEKPAVASLPDGRFAVAFSANADVYVQRYDTRGAKITGDQAAPVNDLVRDGNQNGAAIAATTGASGSYAVAWVDMNSGHVRARMLGGTSGFLFNNVTGLASEFQASRVDGHVRRTPVVTSGGSGPFVAIGWEDTTSPGAGIVVRRFPLPSE